MRARFVLIAVVVGVMFSFNQQKGYCQDEEALPARLTIDAFRRRVEDLTARDRWQLADIQFFESLLASAPTDPKDQAAVRSQLDAAVKHITVQINRLETTIDADPQPVLEYCFRPRQIPMPPLKAEGFAWPDEPWQEVQWLSGTWQTELPGLGSDKHSFYIHVIADPEAKSIQVTPYQVVDGKVQHALPTTSPSFFVKWVSGSPQAAMTVSNTNDVDGFQFVVTKKGEGEFVLQEVASRGEPKSAPFYRSSPETNPEAKVIFDYLIRQKTEQALEVARQAVTRLKDLHEHIRIRSAVVSFITALRQYDGPNGCLCVRHASVPVERHYGSPNWLSVSLRSNPVGESLAAIVETENQLGVRLGVDIEGRTHTQYGREYRKFEAEELLPLQKFKNLRSLSLKASTIDRAGLKILHPITTLESLDLGYTKLSDEDLKHVPPHIEQLFLDHTQVTDQGLVHLKRLENLTHLVLDGTNITDEGLRHLASLESLEILRVRDTRITEAGLAHVIDLPKLSKISVSVSTRFKNPRKLSSSGVKFLNEHGYEDTGPEFTKKKDK